LGTETPLEELLNPPAWLTKPLQIPTQQIAQQALPLWLSLAKPGLSRQNVVPTSTGKPIEMTDNDIPTPMQTEPSLSPDFLPQAFQDVEDTEAQMQTLQQQQLQQLQQFQQQQLQRQIKQQQQQQLLHLLQIQASNQMSLQNHLAQSFAQNQILPKSFAHSQIPLTQRSQRQEPLQEVIEKEPREGKSINTRSRAKKRQLQAAASNEAEMTIKKKGIYSLNRATL
jgi:hypothetical protein